MGIRSAQLFVTQAHDDLITLPPDLDLPVTHRRVTDDCGRRGLREGEFLLVGADPLLDFRFHRGLELEVAFRGRALDLGVRTLIVEKGHPVRQSVSALGPPPPAQEWPSCW